MRVRAILLCAVASLALAGVADAGGQSPVFGTSVDVVLLAGKVFVTAPGRTSVPLVSVQQLPVGSTVDATNGQVRVVAVDAAGATHSGGFAEGAFTIRQPLSERGVVEIDLAAPLSPCGGAFAARASRGRHLTSKTDPYYSSNGYSARTTPARHLARDAAVVMTTWEVADGCAGTQRTTVVQATQGTVAVSSPVTHKPVANNRIVTAGARPTCYSGHVRVHGRFSVRGRFSVATIRGSRDAGATRISPVLRALYGSVVVCPSPGGFGSATVRG